LRSFDDRDPGLLAAGQEAFAGFSLRCVARTASTQELVRAAARGGAATGFCAVAEEQTAGRGRQGRHWVAPAGAALLCSVLIRTGGRLEWLPLAAGVAVAEAVATVCPVAPRLRWPNDVMAPGGGKLGGILAEVEPAAPGGGTAVAVGIGINVSVDGFPQGIDGASLHRLCPAEPPRREALLGALLLRLSSWLDVLELRGTDAVAAAWTALAIGLGDPLRAETPTGAVVGHALGLDADGALVVVTDFGEQVRLVAADVHLTSVVR